MGIAAKGKSTYVMQTSLKQVPISLNIITVLMQVTSIFAKSTKKFAAQ